MKFEDYENKQYEAELKNWKDHPDRLKALVLISVARANLKKVEEITNELERRLEDPSNLWANISRLEERAECLSKEILDLNKNLRLVL